jgi:hypothetical protein
LLGTIVVTTLRLFYRLLAGSIIGYGAAVLPTALFAAIFAGEDKQTPWLHRSVLGLSLMNGLLAAIVGGFAGGIVGALGTPWRVTRQGSSIWKGACIGALLAMPIAAMYTGLVTVIIASLFRNVLDERRETVPLASMFAGAAAGLFAGIVGNLLLRLRARSSSPSSLDSLEDEGEDPEQDDRPDF